jgi:hypothetical protein
MTSAVLGVLCVRLRFNAENAENAERAEMEIL